MAVAHGGTATRRFAPCTVGASRLDAEAAEGVSLPPRLLRRHPTSQTAHSAYRSSLLDASPLFSMPLDSSTLAQSISVEFHRGGTKPEVVFLSGSRCCRRVFHVALDHPRLTHSSETSSTAPEYYFRFGASMPDFRPTRLAEPPTVPIRRKIPSRTPATASKPIPLAKILQVCCWSKNSRKRLLQPHPTGPTSCICIR